MSIYYKTLCKKVPARDLFDGRLEEFGVREVFTEETTPWSRLLTDGRYYVWAHVSDGVVGDFTRYAGNVAHKILAAIEAAFDVEIVSEYQPEYWGFETDAEWNAWQEEEARKDDERFYDKLMKYLRGEDHDITPGTNGASWAEDARILTERNPSLLLPENKEEFMRHLREIMYGSGIKVTLSPEDVELARLINTHVDDLPRA